VAEAWPSVSKCHAKGTGRKPYLVRSVHHVRSKKCYYTFPTGPGMHMTDDR
jgi:hypothetical protein